MSNCKGVRSYEYTIRGPGQSSAVSTDQASPLFNDQASLSHEFAISCEY